MTPSNFSNVQFLKLEIHITVKMHFYEKVVDRSCIYRGM